MAFVPKEWKDRLVEFAGRRKLTNVATGEEIIVDVARNEGAVSQEGDAFSAENMNSLEQRIKDGFDKVNTNLVCVKYDGSLPNAYSFYLYKRNNDVYLNGYFSGSFSKNSIITTLPEGFRPKTKLSGVCVMSRSSSSSQYISGADVDINTDGTIVSTNDTSWVAIIFNTKFPIDI